MAIGDRIAGRGPAKTYSSQRANPNAFGAGVARALDTLGGAMDDATSAVEAMSLRVQQRAEKTEGFDAQERWVRWQGEQNRVQAERIRNTSESAAGITNQTNDELAVASEEFIQSLPTRLQDEYRVKVAAYEEGAITSAFNYEYTAGNEKFVKDVNQTMNTQASAVLTGDMSADEARANVLELIGKSDLDAAAQRDLTDQANAFIDRVEYQKELEYAIDFKGTVEPKSEGDVVAAGLLPHERGILNAISREESSDRYDVIYGGEKITDFSDHPRKYVTITSGPNKGKKSSAAGKYQFLASTWDAAVKRYNAKNPDNPVTDFSPEAQDRIAIDYARHIYNRQVGAGEPNFDQVLTSGNRELIVSMKDALHDGRGGWEAFRTMSDDAFYNIISGSAGIAGGGTGSSTGPDVWNDPKYANISFTDKLSLANSAQTAVAARDRDVALAAKQQKEAQTEQLMMQAQQNQYTLADLDNLIKSGQLDNSTDVTKWKNIVKQAANDFGQTNRVREALTNGGFISLEDNKALNSLLGNQGEEAVLARDTDYAEQTLLPIASRAGYFPSDIAKQLNSMVIGNDAASREYALGVLSTAASADPNVLERTSGLSDNAKRQVELVNALRGMYTPEQIRERLEVVNDPSQSQAVNEVRKQGRKLFSETVTDAEITSVFETALPGDEPSMPMTIGQSAALRQDYQTAYTEGYLVTQDEAGAKAYADQLIKKHWAVSEIGGRRSLSKFPPETFYQTIQGSHDWIDLQARNDLGFDADVEFQLMPDAQTAQEGKAFNQAEDKAGLNNASYQVAFLNDQGVVEVMLDDDGAPIRWAAEITPEMRTRIDENAQVAMLKERKAAFEARIMSHDKPTEAEVADYDATVEQLEELRELHPDRNFNSPVPTRLKVEVEEQLAKVEKELEEARSTLFPGLATPALEQKKQRLLKELEGF
jgi:muramidase (phage lysozyme)